jgi:hypothetical protein
MPTGKTTAHVSIGLSGRWLPKNGQVNAGPWNIEFKVQRNTGTTGSPVWTDIGSVQSSNPDPYIDSGSEGTFTIGGTLAYELDDAGRTAGQIYEYQVVARVSSGTVTGNSGGISWLGGTSGIVLTAP